MSLLEEWKKNYNVIKDYSEEIFGLKEQPEDQCPTIDSIVRDINYAIKASEKAEYWLDRDDYDDTYNYISQTQQELYGLEDELEKLRECIIEIRAWGQEWKDFAKQLIDSGKIDINEYVTDYYKEL